MADIEVLCTNGVKEAVLELVPAFERAHGHRVAATYGATKNIAEQVAGGARADLLVLTSEAIDDLLKQGKVAAGSRVDIARSGIGVAVRKGARKPDIGTVEAFKRALLAAKTISHSKSGASGIYFANVVVPRLGIAEAIKSKIVMPPPGKMVGDLLANGEAELGLQQISELLPVAGVEIVGPLPGDLQKITIFSAGLCVGAKQPDAARALAKFLAAPAARPVIVRKGMEPAEPRG